MTSFDVDPVRFDSMLHAMKSWRFNESGDVMPEDQEKFDDLMGSWDEDYDGFYDMEVDDGQPTEYDEWMSYDPDC